MTVLTLLSNHRDTLLSMYAAMVKTRLCEEAVLSLAGADYLPVRGQEAVAAGTAAALDEGDRLVTTRRCLHELVACGVPLRDVVRLAAAQWGAAEARASAPAHGVIFSTGTPGAGIPVAAGAALAAKVTGSDRVVVVSFGDGATNTGAFHEAANLAAVQRLPLVLLCQNNLYSRYTPVLETMRINRIAARAQAYGMPGRTVDGNDPVAVREAVGEAVALARAGGGPMLVECVTFRLGGYRAGDGPDYIPPEDLAMAMAEDPVPRYERWLRETTGIDPESLARIASAARREVEEVISW
ncbi:thiamine pyrophosphate-dependent dehydrogenase E1 component subunit alpha [Fodinicola acaciae]|uniref:thiamine pyrophosphate-dependent dehydrogenase E1 component subunit alpha n=1 Tax=Fodinicola acaciae TaxID=2681555 RepID=UPI0013D8A2FC|nr:thiamine pyrophosphate-dependent dehydrogenase E1 component subunit alpha [Fodinicola acaciae]